jgi:hypothetical protein
MDKKNKDPLHRARLAFSRSTFFMPWLIFSSITAFAEPIFCPFNLGLFLMVQYALIGLSGFLFIVGILATAAYIEEDISYLRRVLLACRDIGLEVTCLLFGGIFMALGNHGFASLRCFRVFRLFWYYEILMPEHDDEWDPTAHMVSLSQTSHLCVNYLERLALEFASAASRGGSVVLFILFYLTFVLAVMYWYQFNDLVDYLDPDIKSCATLKLCFLTLLRLTFYDGTGFDFLQSVIDNGNSGWAVGLILYMCVTGMILLNGLIGIFGHAFISDAEAEKDKENERELERLKFGRQHESNEGDDAYFKGDKFSKILAEDLPFLREIWDIRIHFKAAKKLVTKLETKMQKVRYDIDALKKHTRTLKTW